MNSVRQAFKGLLQCFGFTWIPRATRLKTPWTTCRRSPSEKVFSDRSGKMVRRSITEKTRWPFQPREWPDQRPAELPFGIGTGFPCSGDWSGFWFQ